MDNLLTIEQTAKILGIPVQTAYTFARRKVFPTIRMGRLVKVHPDQLREWMANGGQAQSALDADNVHPLHA